MTKLVRLSSVELQRAMKSLPKWKTVVEDGHMDHIRRSYQFKTFEVSWSFLTRVAMKAHRSGHHPTIINKYNVVELELTTHDVGGISELDVKMAKSLDKAALQMGGDHQIDE